MSNNNHNHNQDLTSKRRKVSSEDNIDQDINSKIIVSPKNPNHVQIDANDIQLPQVTIESKEIYQSLHLDKISVILQCKNVNKTIIEHALSDMIINGYKIDWKRLPFDIRIIKTVFDALATNGVTADMM